MTKALGWFARTFGVMVVVASVAACAGEAPVGVNLTSAGQSTLAAAVDLGPCPELAVPEGSTLISHVYARGYQIYRWNGTSWAPVGPSATLYANRNETAVVGTHYTGPYWESLSGSKVKGTVSKRCTAGNPAYAIQWLLLDAESEGPGIFGNVRYIQRLNTIGGVAPGHSGTMNQEVSVPYSTEYYFYR